MKTLTLTSFLLTGTLAIAQTEWVVDASGGPGADFTDIQSAVDAAVDGDRILVRAGLYAGFTIDSEGLSVLGESGASLLASPPSVVVRNTAVGQDVVLAGLSGWGPTPFAGAWIERCQGRVLLDRLYGESWRISDSSDVRVNDCRVGGTVDVARSRATFAGSTLSAGPSNYEAAPALGVVDSEVMVARCSLSGQPQFLRLPASPALVIQAPSVVTLTDDGSHSVVAGTPLGGGLSAIVGDGTLIRDPRVRVMGALGAPGVSVGTDRVEHTPALQALGAPVGSTIEVDLAGLPGESWALVFGLPGSPLRLPGIRGELGFSQALVSLQGVFSARSEHLSLRAGPGLPPGFALCWQGLATDGHGGFVLSNHATYTRMR